MVALRHPEGMSGRSQLRCDLAPTALECLRQNSAYRLGHQHENRLFKADGFLYLQAAFPFFVSAQVFLLLLQSLLGY